MRALPRLVIGLLALQAIACFGRTGLDLPGVSGPGDTALLQPGDSVATGDSAGDSTGGGDAVATNTPPTIDLIGETNMVAVTDSTFVDPGALAVDAEDGDLSAAIVITGFIETSTEGLYHLRYSVTDSDGNGVSALRSVRVRPFGIDAIVASTTDSSVMIDVTLNDPGTVYFVVYDNVPATRVTAQMVVDNALSTVDPNRIAGSSASAGPYDPISFGNSGLAGTSPDTVYVVAENAVTGLTSDDDVFAFYRTRGVMRRFHETLTQTAHDGVPANTVVRYDISLPEGYGISQPRNLPAMLFLHGWGERNTTTNSLTGFLGEMYADAGVYAPTRTVPYGVLMNLWEGEPFDGVIVSPQCSQAPFNCTLWNEGIGAEALRHASAHYPIDANRVVVSGVSFGGTGAYNFAASNPGLVAAAAPISMGATFYAGLAPSDCPFGGNVDIWAFHNASDTNGPTSPNNTIDMVTALSGCGATAEAWLYYIEGSFTPPATSPPGVLYVPSDPLYYNAWPASHHSGDDETYANPAFWTWVWSRGSAP